MEILNGSSDHHHHQVQLTRRSSDPQGAKLVAAAVPGRATRRQQQPRRRTKTHKSFCRRFYSYWIERRLVANVKLSSSSSLAIAVILWYSLGVISIGTTKILLSNHELGSNIGNVPPIYLTLQQLLIGSTLLKFFIDAGLFGSSKHVWSTHVNNNNLLLSKISSKERRPSAFPVTEYIGLFQTHPNLAWSAVFFMFGFLFTNFGFSAAAANFVETIKASEPITSACVATYYGIEQLTLQEIFSLLAIVVGVVLSTLGNSHHLHDSTTSTNVALPASSTGIHADLKSSLWATGIVLIANLCFSFRGLHQKLFRASPDGSTRAMDDLNLQYRMQQLGALFLVLPVAVLEGSRLIRTLFHVVIVLPFQGDVVESGSSSGIGASVRLSSQYVAISISNGMAFTLYNLSSTYILSRISVVLHATLNCIRRIFAIFATSLLFRVPVTRLGMQGIGCSLVGFMLFSHFRSIKNDQSRIAAPSVGSLLPTTSNSYR